MPVVSIAVVALVCAAAMWSPRPPLPPPMVIRGRFSQPMEVELREHHVGACCEGGEVASASVLVTGDMDVRLVARETSHRR